MGRRKRDGGNLVGINLLSEDSRPPGWPRRWGGRLEGFRGLLGLASSQSPQAGWSEPSGMVGAGLGEMLLFPPYGL